MVPAVRCIVAPTLCAAGSKPNIEHGKTTFEAMCGVCHSVQETGGPTQGPNLLGLVGRKAGTLMPMLIQDNKTRADVVAYLATLKNK
jgi:cytochrome c2